MSRLKQLIEFYEANPTDPFIIYGIALEYQNTDVKKAEAFFINLLENYPAYLPTYYHAGKLFEALEKIEKAKGIYAKGIELSQIQKDSHTERELKNALNELLFDE